MRKIEEILRLKYEAGLSHRAMLANPNRLATIATTGLEAGAGLIIDRLEGAEIVAGQGGVNLSR
jgi:hypothetical protein